jgi:GNAT superfamily N-acetyltransferase
MAPPAGLVIRPATSDRDLEVWNRVRRITLPDEPIPTVDQLRAMTAEDGRLYLLAEERGSVVANGVAAPSSLADGFVAPRVLPQQRRRGIGSAILDALLDHHRSIGRRSAAAHAEGDAALEFASRHGFIEVDRQVEQVRAVTAGEPPPPVFPGVEFTSIEADSDLLRRAYPLAEQGHADLALAQGRVVVSLQEWLRDEASLPGGSIVALADGEIVGYAGLIAWNDDDTRAENGLTVVDRPWRRRGLAAAMKRHQLAWAAGHGIREIVTWTQQGNEAMQRVNLRLGYVTRTISHTVRREPI